MFTILQRYAESSPQTRICWPMHVELCIPHISAHCVCTGAWPVAAAAVAPLLSNSAEDAPMRSFLLSACTCGLLEAKEVSNTYITVLMAFYTKSL
jgi:hypothetical protein